MNYIKLVKSELINFPGGLAQIWNGDFATLGSFCKTLQVTLAGAEFQPIRCQQLKRRPLLFFLLRQSCRLERLC
jgi:hypothetical protein